MIKPCPFCKDLNVIIVRPVSGNIKKMDGLPYQVMCIGCHGRGPEKDTKDEAVERWNMLDELYENYRALLLRVVL